MRIKIQRTRCWRVCGSSKPLILWLDGSRGRRMVHVHRRESLVSNIQHEITQDLSVCDGLMQTNIAYLTNARKEAQDEFQTSP
jgi:hypothetical protein